MSFAWEELDEYMKTLEIVFERLSPAETHTSDEYTTRLRNKLTYYGLDLKNPHDVAVFLFTLYSVNEQAERLRFLHFHGNKDVEKFLDTFAMNMGLLARDLLKDIEVKES
jgi:hypothetical protein